MSTLHCVPLMSLSNNPIFVILSITSLVLHQTPVIKENFTPTIYTTLVSDTVIAGRLRAGLGVSAAEAGRRCRTAGVEGMSWPASPSD